MQNGFIILPEIAKILSEHMLIPALYAIYRISLREWNTQASMTSCIHTIPLLILEDYHLIAGFHSPEDRAIRGRQMMECPMLESMPMGFIESYLILYHRKLLIGKLTQIKLIAKHSKTSDAETVLKPCPPQILMIRGCGHMVRHGRKRIAPQCPILYPHAFHCIGIIANPSLRRECQSSKVITIASR